MSHWSYHPGDKTARSIVLLCLLVALVATAACEDPARPEPVTVDGRWEGFIGWGVPPYTFTGDMVVMVNEAGECSVDGTMLGTLLGWNEFELRFAGTLYLDVFNAALGEITITRYRAGIDTVQVIGTMTGDFDLEQAVVLGEWECNPGEAFNISGELGGVKKKGAP